MATGTGTYHQQLAEQKRAAIIAAATSLFLAGGYAGTSLARVAEAAEVSKATLFKPFPPRLACSSRWSRSTGDRTPTTVPSRRPATSAAGWPSTGAGTPR